MTDVIVSDQLDEKTRLWRYLSLDKLVDLLSTSELFFTPLASFAKSDPFEGYLPDVAMEALGSIFHQPIKDIEVGCLLVEEHRKSIGHELTEQEHALLQEKMDNLKAAPRRYYTAIAKSIVVNCWHINCDESEAMWRLYGDGGKGIALTTTLGALRESIKGCGSMYRVHIYPVKYLDFFDKALSPKDCVVEGRHLAPLLKRISYEHEHEVRAFIVRVPATTREAENVEFWKPAPVRLPVNLKRLVKAVYVSPYAEEPFPSSVKRICDAFGLPEGTVQLSKLLSGHEELLDRLLL